MDPLTAEFLANVTPGPARRRKRVTSGTSSAGRPPIYGEVTTAGRELAVRIRRARGRRGWTQSILAVYADTSRRMVGMIEAGHEVLPPAQDQLKRIKESLDLN